MKIQFLASVVALAAIAGTATAGISGPTAYGLSSSGTTIYTWDVNNPANTNFVGSITGLQSAETIDGIDFRPATGELYGVSNQSRIYKISTSNGAATQVGSAAFTPPIAGSSIGMDFNPTVDRIRITSSAGENYRLHPVTGALVFNDIALNGATNRSVASAYTNSFAGATSTTLYNLDSGTNSLYTQIPPNNGTTNLIGGLGVDFDDNAGFDIHGANAYAVLNTGANFSGFYQINLATGAATLLGEVGDFQRGTIFFKGLAIIPTPGAFGLVSLAGLASLRRRR